MTATDAKMIIRNSRSEFRKRPQDIRKRLVSFNVLTPRRGLTGANKLSDGALPPRKPEDLGAGLKVDGLWCRGI